MPVKILNSRQEEQIFFKKKIPLTPTKHDKIEILPKMKIWNHSNEVICRFLTSILAIYKVYGSVGIFSKKLRVGPKCVKNVFWKFLTRLKKLQKSCASYTGQSFVRTFLFCFNMAPIFTNVEKWEL